jgi:hypothetical protein
MHDPEWRELLAPVFQAAGIPFNKVHIKYARTRRPRDNAS